MKHLKVQHFISWFKFIDIEYLDDDKAIVLSKFDINDPTDQEEIIKIAIIPEIEGMNNISKNELMQLLIRIDEYPEADIRKIMQQVGMPFQKELIDYKVFFKNVLNAVENYKTLSC